MKILSFNMCYGTGVIKPYFFMRYFIGRSSMANHLATFVRTLNPDVLAVTEIPAGRHQDLMTRNGFFQTIFSYLKYAPWCARVPFLRKNHNAVFVKAQDVPCRTHYLQAGFKKLVIQTHIRPDIDLFTVHLSLGRKTRARQLAELSMLLAHSPRHKIVTGDFNTFGGVTELTTFMQRHQLRSFNIKNDPTFPTWKPKYELDFFLVSPGIIVKNFEVLHTALSDHLPIMLEIV